MLRTKDHIFVVTDLCNGDLNKRAEKKLSEKDAWAFTKQMIKGYKALH